MELIVEPAFGEVDLWSAYQICFKLSSEVHLAQITARRGWLGERCLWCKGRAEM